MKSYVFGVDLGGTTVKIGLFTAEGSLLEKWEIPTHTEENGRKILPEIAESLEAKMQERSISAAEVAGIGIGVPGPVDSNSNVFKCVNLGWDVFNIRDKMNELLPEIPNVIAGNDANVAALGELWQGCGKGHRSAVMFTLGTGVGGGVIVDGKIIAGFNGSAGELGHMTVNPTETAVCGCGKRGCLEQYVSANGIVRMAKVMLADCDTPSALRSRDRFTAKDICDLARDGEPMAAEIIDRFGDYLGRAMSFVACTTDPEIFIIGGGMSRAGAIIVDAAMKYFQTYAFHTSVHTKAVIAELGNDAGIYGCAKMILP